QRPGSAFPGQEVFQTRPAPSPSGFSTPQIPPMTFPPVFCLSLMVSSYIALWLHFTGLTQYKSHKQNSSPHVSFSCPDGRDRYTSDELLPGDQHAAKTAHWLAACLVSIRGGGGPERGRALPATQP